MIGGRPGKKALPVGIDGTWRGEGERGLDHADLQCACSSTFLTDFAGFGRVLVGLSVVLILATIVVHACHHIHPLRLHRAWFYG